MKKRELESKLRAKSFMIFCLEQCKEKMPESNQSWNAQQKDLSIEIKDLLNEHNPDDDIADNFTSIELTGLEIATKIIQSIYN